MPRRIRRARRFPVRGKAKRSTTWIDLGIGTDAADVAAGTLSTNQLFLMSDELEATTCLRIVGTVFCGLQATGAAVVMAYWGLYWLGNLDDATIADPSTATGVSSENLMFWRAIPCGNSDLNQTTRNISQYYVDIRARRKLVGGDSLSLQFNCSDAYSQLFALRGLFYAD